jgi:hypothetical protein
VAGVGYLITVMQWMRRQQVYVSEFEDWLFHLILPFVAYLAFIVVAAATSWQLHDRLLMIGAGALALLLAGIHNAWDAVSYHLARKAQDGKTK